MSKLTYPKYATLDGMSAVRLDSITPESAKYYRPAGQWSVKARWEGKELVTFGTFTNTNYKAGRKVLKECTYKQFKLDNKGYL